MPITTYRRNYHYEIRVKENLTKHELGDLARLVENQEGDIALADLSFDARLEQLLEELICERENKHINRLIKTATFKCPMASIESLDFDTRQVKKNTIINLASMGFVTTATNLIITDSTGAGKTYLSCVLEIEACKKLTGFSTSECLI